MGVLNVTPDSFSDGGKWIGFQDQLDHALRMVDEGADWIDVGGESTRPGAQPVGEAEEVRRVLPVIEALSERGVAVSIDTVKASVARAALAAGAQMINDVSGFRDPVMVELVHEKRPPKICIMHMQGEPRTMQQNPIYLDVVGEVETFLLSQARLFSGLPTEILIDPGIGFGKTLGHNLALLRATARLASHGYPVLVGASRKSMMKLLGAGDSPEDRLEGTLAIHAFATTAGARWLRVHDVAAHTKFFRVWDRLADRE